MKSLAMKYKRILLKLSGEALMGQQNHGIDPIRLNNYAAEIKEIQEQGTEIAIVIGGVISLEVFRVRAKVWIVYKQIIWACWRL